MNKPILCCFKIKSATLLIGTFDLMLHMMILATLFASILNPGFLENAYLNSQDTPFSINSNNNNNNAGLSRNNIDLDVHHQSAGASISIGASSSNHHQSARQPLSTQPTSSQTQLNNNNNLFPLLQQQKHKSDLSSFHESPMSLSSASSQLTSNNSSNIKFPSDYLWLNSNTLINKQDRSIAVLVTTCSSLITMMLIYGILYNKPSYLMPYFSIKVFQVVIACLTTLGFYSTLPDIKFWLKTQSFFPFRDTLLTLDRQTLELFLFAVFLMTILVKLYVVIIVWYCYRYMITIESYRNQTLYNMRSGNNSYMGANSGINFSNGDDNRNGFKIDDESLLTNGFGLPPKYEDIIKQSKQEMSKLQTNGSGTSMASNLNTSSSPSSSSVMPTTSANVSSASSNTTNGLFKQNVDENDLLQQSDVEQSASKSLVNNDSVDSCGLPPSYTLAIKNKTDQHVVS